MRHPGTRLVALLIGAMASVPSFAAHWIVVGGSSPGQAPSKLMVDTDSVHQLDEFTIIDIMTVYAAPIVNAHNITLDRFVHTTAIDCAKRTFVGLITTGYLGEKRVGSGGEIPDWRHKAIPLPNDAASNRIYQVACGSAARRPPPK